MEKYSTLSPQKEKEKENLWTNIMLHPPPPKQKEKE